MARHLKRVEPRQFYTNREAERSHRWEWVMGAAVLACLAVWALVIAEILHAVGVL